MDAGREAWCRHRLRRRGLFGQEPERARRIVQGDQVDDDLLERMDRVHGESLTDLPFGARPHGLFRERQSQLQDRRGHPIDHLCHLWVRDLARVDLRAAVDTAGAIVTSPETALTSEPAPWRAARILGSTFAV